MKKVQFILAIGCLLIAGCAPANITSAKWDSGLNNANVQTRCERADLRNQSEMSALFKKYDGWKVIYISEYTTANKFGTDAVVCFERSK